MLWPRGALPKLGRILAALSLFGLLRISLDFGYSEIVSSMMTSFGELIAAIFIWANPLIDAALLSLRKILNLPLETHGAWRQIAFLLCVYIFRDLEYMVRIGLRYSALAILLCSLPVIIFSAVAADIISFKAQSFREHLAAPSLVILGMFFYELIDRIFLTVFHFKRQTAGRNWPQGTTRLQYFTHQITADFIRAVILFLTAIGALVIPAVHSSANPGILASVVVIIGAAAYWMYQALEHYLDERAAKRSGVTLHTIFSHSNFVVGASMLSAFFWVALLALANAGLRLFEL